jgi:hypothetical protein
VTGTMSKLLDMAGSVFGGVLGTAANVGDRVHSLAWEKAHDEAFQAAIREIQPDFIQCPCCSAWMCRKSCWSNKRGLCKACAPDLGVEMSAAQASRSVEEVWAHAAMAQKDQKLGKENWQETIRASCPQCEAPLAANAKFGPQCGTTLQASNTAGNAAPSSLPRRNSVSNAEPRRAESRRGGWSADSDQSLDSIPGP